MGGTASGGNGRGGDTSTDTWQRHGGGESSSGEHTGATRPHSCCRTARAGSIIQYVARCHDSAAAERAHTQRTEATHAASERASSTKRVRACTYVALVHEVLSQRRVLLLACVTRANKHIVGGEPWKSRAEHAPASPTLPHPRVRGGRTPTAAACAPHTPRTAPRSLHRPQPRTHKPMHGGLGGGAWVGGIPGQRYQGSPTTVRRRRHRWRLCASLRSWGRTGAMWRGRRGSWCGGIMVGTIRKEVVVRSGCGGRNRPKAAAVGTGANDPHVTRASSPWPRTSCSQHAGSARTYRRRPLP